MRVTVFLTALFVSLCLFPGALLAQDDYLAATAGVPLNFTETQLLANDGIDPKEFEIIKWPQSGTLEKTGPGTWTFLPPAEPWSHYGYQTEEFTYRASNRQSTTMGEVTIRLIPSKQLLSLDWRPHTGEGKLGWFRPESRRFVVCTLSSGEGSPPENDGNPCLEAEPVAGVAPRIAFSGNWQGDGQAVDGLESIGLQEGVGLYDPATGTVERFDVEIHGGSVVEVLSRGIHSTGRLDGWPIVGDWNADGVDEVMIWQPAQGLLHDVEGVREVPTVTLPIGLFSPGELQPIVGQFDPYAEDVLAFIYPSAGALTVLDASFSSIDWDHKELLKMSGVQIIGRVMEDHVALAGYFDFSTRIIEFARLENFQVQVLPVTIPDDPD